MAVVLSGAIVRQRLTRWPQIRHHDHLALVWEDIFNCKLGVDPSQHSLILTEPVNNSPFSAERTATSMFETFQVHAVHELGVG